MKKNMISKLLSLLVTLAMLTGLLTGLALTAAAANGTWDGDGDTETTAFEIADVADLAMLAKTVTKQNSYAGKYFKLTGDIDLTDWLAENAGTEGWTPIGHWDDVNMTQPFCGNFDGQGFTISGLWINRPNARSVGLFGSTKNNRIQNLSVIVADHKIVEGRSAVGTLAGETDGSTILNCNGSGEVYAGSAAGGLVGYQYGGLIDGCHFNGTVRVPDEDSSHLHAGGLVALQQNEAVLQNSSADASVSGHTGIGGLVGAADANGCVVQDSFSKGTVNGSIKVGGLIGRADLKHLERCYSESNVTGTNQHIGGLLGSSSSLEMKNCYATGSVSGSTIVGGLVGSQTGGTSVVENCYAAGAVTGRSKLGGLIGSLSSYTKPEGLKNNYFDTDATGQTVGISDNDKAGVSGKTTTELKTKATFSEWDFTGNGTNPPIWYIREGEAYPMLGSFVDYTVNDAPYAWSDSNQITLHDGGDELRLLADAGPAVSTEIKLDASAKDDFEASLIGRPDVTYDNLYIMAAVDSDADTVRLNLQDLNFTAPTDKNGIQSFTTWTGQTGNPCAELDVTGECSVQGGDGNSGISVDINLSINGDSLRVQGGNSMSGNGGGGIETSKDLTVKGGQITAIGGDGIQGGQGIYSNQTVSISGGTILAIGGRSSDSATGAIGAGLRASDLIVSGGALTATGGDGKQADDNINAFDAAGAGIYALNGVNLTGGSTVAQGGTAILGGYGMLTAYSGITVQDGANLEAVGGMGTQNSGGVGMNVNFSDGDAALIVENSAGSVYIRGGLNKEQRESPSVTAKKAYIATGNIGRIDTFGGDIKNIPGGDDIHKLTADTSPLAPNAVFQSIVTTDRAGLPSYTYTSPAKGDGIAYLWLPAGKQTVSTPGYADGTVTVQDDNATAVTLRNDYTVNISYFDGTTFVGRQQVIAAYGSEVTAFTPPSGYVVAAGTTIMVNNSLNLDHKYRTADISLPVTKKIYSVHITYIGEGSTQSIEGKQVGDSIVFSELNLPKGYTTTDFTDVYLDSAMAATAEDRMIALDIPVTATDVTVTINYQSQDIIIGTQVLNVIKGTWITAGMLSVPFGYEIGAFDSVVANVNISLNVEVTASSAKSVTVLPGQMVLTLEKDKEGYASAIVSPSRILNSGVIWESSDPAIVAVDVYGRITPAAKGFAVIKAVSNQTNSVYGECIVVVVEPDEPYVEVLPDQASWNKQAVTVSMDVYEDSDQTPGLTASAYYKVTQSAAEAPYADDGSWTVYKQPFVLDTDGTHYVHWYAENKMGKATQGVSNAFKIDTALPEITSAKATAKSRSQIDLTAQAADTGSGLVDYAWYLVKDDGDILLSTNKEYSHTGLTSGTLYMYKLIVADLAGNVAEQALSTTTDKSSGGGGGTSSYVVAFESNGGSMVASQRVTWNKTVTKPNDPTKEGYSFAGWYTDPQLTKVYDFNTKVTKSITLYASWKANTTLPPVEQDEWLEAPFITGYPDGTFGPENGVTRAETTQILYNLFGRDTKADLNLLGSLMDMDKTHWAANAFAWAVGQGYFQGYPDGTVRPDQTISRAEMAALLQRIVEKEGLQGGGGPTQPSLSDIDSHWAYNAILLLAGKGIIQGYPDGTFGPENPVTRAEAVTMIARLLSRSDTFTAGKTFSDVETEYWAYTIIMNAVNGLKKSV